jgi:cobalt-zinc-cadmium efflux system outer membrane protein
MRVPRHSPAAIALALTVAACSSIPYSPRPLLTDDALADYSARSATSDGLERFAIANGYGHADWPPSEWGLRELTLVALYFHADLDVARARAAAARAQQAAAGARDPMGLRVGPQYHSRELEEDNGPWTLGLELEIPLAATDRRAARVERSAFEADAAELDIAATAWAVRAGVRDAMAELQDAGQAVALLEAQIANRREVLALIERRVDAGMLSAHESGAERLLLSQLELALARAAAREQGARARLAPAVGLPVDVVNAMQFRFDVPPADVAASNESSRRLALRNRLDVHRKLLEFGAADADVKLAVASQNPQVTLGPGYAWDQGDNIWSLAVGLSFPPAARARALVRENEARREVAAQEFLATQAAAISTAESAATQFRFSLDRVAVAQRQLELQRTQEARVARQFEAGSADRLQRALARSATLAGEESMQVAQAEARRALARLEDAVQHPLFGDFPELPDVSANRRDQASPPSQRATP